MQIKQQNPRQRGALSELEPRLPRRWAGSEVPDSNDSTRLLPPEGPAPAPGAGTSDTMTSRPPNQP